jgi:uncharacterized protein (DUF58 family)
VILRRLRTKKALAAIAIAAGAALATVGSAGSAVAFFSPPLLLLIHVDSPATLIAKGAGADVTLEIECAGVSGGAFVNVSLTERSGSQVAQAFGSTQVGCTGQNEIIVVPVTAQPGKVLKKGTAIADASIFGCSTRVCGSEEDRTTITVR